VCPLAIAISCAQPNITEAAQPEPTTWSQDRRFKFIDYRLRWEGRLRRTDLTEFFNISLPQASADLSKYDRAAPENLKYDEVLRSRPGVPGDLGSFGALITRAHSEDGGSSFSRALNAKRLPLVRPQRV
jgi:hypothetical protein